MSAQNEPAKQPPLDLSKWRNVPTRLILGGGLVALVGLGLSFGHNHDGGQQFAYCWLLAFMFCLSIGLGALFLVLAHHLFDAGWSVPIRRFCEHICNLLVPWMLVLFIPIAIKAKSIFPWMNKLTHPDHALHAKNPLFTMPG